MNNRKTDKKEMKTKQYRKLSYRVVSYHYTGEDLVEIISINIHESVLTFR